MFVINKKVCAFLSGILISGLALSISPINLITAYAALDFSGAGGSGIDFSGAMTDSTGGSDPFGSISGTGNEVPTKDAFVRAMQKAFNMKEFNIDAIAYNIVNKIIERMSASIVDWINSGFEGKPAFVQDLKGYFNDLESQVLGSYLNELGAGFLCSPFANKIKRSLELQLAVSQSGGRNAKEAKFRKANQCTLDDVLSSIGTTIDQFQNDFSKGGWPAWITINESRNNELGAYLLVRNELFRRQGETTQYAQAELSFGSGFMSWKKKCGLYSTPSGAAPTASEQETYSDIPYDGEVDDTQVNYQTGEVVQGGYTGRCIDPTEGQIQTPGSVIEKQLNEALGSGERRLEVADEINEIISALLNQLMTQALGGAGGLLGASQSGPGKTSYTNNLRDTNPDLTNTKQDLSSNINQSIGNINRVINIKQIALTEVNQMLAELESLNQCLANLDASGKSYPAGKQNYLENKAYLDGIKSKLLQDITQLTNIRASLTNMLQQLNRSTTLQELNNIATQYINVIGPLAQIEDPTQAELELANIRTKITTIRQETSTDLNQCRNIESGSNFGI